MRTVIRRFQSQDTVSVESIYSLYWPDGEFRTKLSKRLQEAITASPESISQGFEYLVAEDNKKVVGIVGFRKIPLHLQEFTHSKNPAELYIIAVKNRGRGIGTLLITEVLKEVAELGYSEIVLYSGETHKESWEFYDNYGFKRVRGALAPDGEKGFVWTMDL